MLVSWLKLVSGLGLFLIICLGLKGCGPTQKPAPASRPIAPLSYLGAPCNVLTAEGCNPIQLPSMQTPNFDPQCSQESAKCLVDLPAGHDELWDYDHSEQRDEDISAERSESIQEVSRSNSFDFGIAPEVPILRRLAFSAGIEYRRLSQDMDTYRTEQFYANIQRRHIVYSASLSSTAQQKLATAFRDAASHLPTSPDTDDDFAKWFQFFDKFGTHYVKKVSFGGVMRLSLFVKSTVEQDTSIQKDNWNFYLNVMFARLAGIKLPFGPGHNEKEFESFNHYTFKQHFFAKGGNQSELDYQKWMTTLNENNSAPVQTHLGSIEDFFNKSVDFRRILTKYLATCPSSETSGVCNGYGVCDFASGRCECDAMGAYKEEDGNCYPTCQDNCSGHGECKKGQCQCHFDAKANMGFMTADGPPCSTPCGSKVYDAGESHVWCIPGSQGANCKPLGQEAEAAKCWCQGILKSLDVDAGHVKRLDIYGDTYSCDDGSSSCVRSWWQQLDRCPGYQQIQCTHGEYASCAHPIAYHQVDFSGEAAVQFINFSSQKSLIV